MDIAASLIKLFFGSKADKDRKEVEPYLVKIKAVYPDDRGAFERRTACPQQ